MMDTLLNTHESKGDRRRAAKRARFASAMATQVARVSQLEEWYDERFAELDAEVEMHGRQRQGKRRQRETIRRVPSLSVALEKSTDQIILLEGEPGSGKSVALRHVALRMAMRVKEHPSEDGIIPIYLNLKDFRPPGKVDATAVLAFVKASINKANDRYVEIFLEQEFDRGIDEGTWMFLFDSFDEIPAVLGAVEANNVIDQYASALYDFLTGMNACRGVIASREFRGPKRISWPRFRVLRLTDEQRKDLIDKLDLPKDVEQRIIGGLATADAAVRQLADNPLFLALLCEHQRDMKDFPRSSHVVFENYVTKRFEDDKGRLLSRFGLTVQTVRAVAEQAAYCMAAQQGLGLSPARSDLVSGMRHAGFTVHANTTAALDALEYLRLGRAAEVALGQTDGFTFSHRRFQEYFATCLVMRESSRVDPVSLLTDGRWRETTVTLFQTQDRLAIQPLLTQAKLLLADMTALLDGPNCPDIGSGEPPEANIPSDLNGEVQGSPFDWPPGSLHLLGLLQDGFPSGDHRRSRDVEVLGGRLLKTAYSRGQLYDQRWAVEVCLAADPDTTCKIVRQAFASESGWLREAAYTQAGRLDDIPDDVRKQMRSALASLTAGGRLRQQRITVEAQLQRLPDPHPELLLERLFIITPLVDAILWTALGCIEVVLLGPSYLWFVLAFALIGYVALYPARDALSVEWDEQYQGKLSWLYGAVEATLGGDMLVVLGALMVLLRIFAGVLLPIFLLSEKHPGIPIIILVGLAGLFVASWGPAAYRAHSLLDKPRLRGIVVLPLIWPIKTRLRPIRGYLIVQVIVVIILIAWNEWSKWLKPLLHFNAWARQAGQVILVIAILSNTWWLFVIPRNLIKKWHDHMLLERVERGEVQCANFADMLKALALWRTQRGLVLFVQHVKRQQIAEDNPAALRALLTFSAVESIIAWYGIIIPDRLPGNVIARLEPNEIEEMSDWTDSIQRNKRRVTTSQAVRDEIAKIVADGELTRLAALPVVISTPVAAPELLSRDSSSTTPALAGAGDQVEESNVPPTP
jgi:hypothetical protein